MADNNTLATATDLGILGLPQIFADAVGSSDRNDFYKFILDRNSQIEFSLAGLSEPGQLSIIANFDGDEVLDRGEDIEFDTIRDTSSSFADRSIKRSLAAGTYWARVYTYYNNQNTDYTFTAQATPLATSNASDPGNSLTEALDIGRLTLLQTFTDAIGSLDRSDYYKFTLDQNSQIDFSLTGLTEPGQLSIVADFDGDGVFDRGEDVEFDDIRDTNSSAADRSITRTLAAGTYWARVYTYYNNQNTGYTFNAQATPIVPTTSTDPGNTLADAFDIGSLSTLQTFTDAVGSGDFNDYYKFTLDQNSQIDFSLTGLTEPGQLSIIADFDGDGVFDRGEDVEFDDIRDTNSSADDRSITRTLAAGTYWARVYAYYNNQNTGYTFNAQATPIVPTTSTDPGNTLADAFDIGSLSTLQTFTDAVGSGDFNDYYKFTLDQNSQIDFSLTGLTEPGQLSIVADFDGDGVFDRGEDVEFDDIRDTNSSAADRSITRTLAAGTYWARVYTYYNNQNTGYTFNAQATPIVPTSSADPGNTLADAFNIGSLDTLQTFTDAVGSGDFNDYYKFTLDQNSQIDFSLTGLTEPGQLSIIADFDGDGVFDRGEDVEFDDIRDTNSSADDRSITRTLAAGTYWARVYTHYNNQNTGYTFNAQATPIISTSPTDPGSTLADALDIGSLSTLQTFTDVVGSLDRNDYYRFTLDEISQVNLALKDLQEPAQLNLLVDFDDDGIWDSGESIANDGVSDSSSSTAERNISRTLGPGTYGLDVWTYRNYQNTSYSLDVSAVVAPPLTTPDPGNTLTDALDMSTLSNTQSFGNFVGTFDRDDFYRFSIDQPRDLTLQLTGLDGDADIELIADTDRDGQIDSGETLASKRFSDNRDRDLAYALATGTYFVRVTTDRPSDNAAYTLNATAVPATLDRANLNVTGANSPVSASLGESIDVSWTIENNGTQPASGNWYDYIYISDDQILDSSDTFLSSLYTGGNTPLAVGDSYTASKTIQLSDSGVGDRYLLFLADGNGRQAETNESDNVFALPINLGAANLVVSNATGPTNASLQETINVSWTVENQGNRSTSANWYDYVYISDDQILDDTDYRLGYQWSSRNTPIDIGESYTASGNFRIPTEIGAGDRYLIVAADAYRNYQPESDETDNIAILPITIGSPNLVLSDATAPTTASLNETLDVSWTVTNSSTSIAAVNWYDYVYLSADDALDNSDVRLRSRWTGSKTPLTGGSSYTINSTIDIPGTASAGNYHLLFAADAYRNYQSESDETDNIKALPITIGAPNLVVSATTTPTVASLQETINVGWTVTNQGTGTAPANWYDAVYISDDQVLDNNDRRLRTQWTGANTPLAAGDSYSANANITLPNTGIGDRYLLFITDNYGYQGESDETDNVTVVPLSVSAPNLVITGANAPGTASLNQYIDVSWTVANQGAGIAAQNWYDYIYLSDDATLDSSDTRLGSQWTGSNTPLAAGEDYTASRRVLIPNRVASGNRYLIFAADPSNSQGESDDTDNLFSLPINLAGPDLTVSSVSTSGPAVTGETVGLNWTVANRGTAEAQANWSDYIYLSTDDVLDSRDRRLATAATGNQTPLAAGTSYAFSRDIRIPNNVAPGDYHLIVLADGSGNQGETDDTNNAFVLPFQVTGRDLRVVNATTPSSAQLGETIAVNWSVENIGGADATAGWTDQIYVSDDETLDASDRLLAFLPTADQMPLAAGDSYSLNTDVYLPSDISTGNRYLLLVTDGNNDERELDETNNVLAQAITLNGPDLAITASTAPTSASLGDQITLDWTVTNVGNYGATAPTWSDKIYFSTDSTLDATDTLIATQDFNTSGTFAANDTYSRQQTITLPNSLTAGNGYLLMVTDGDAQQGELNEDNNVVASAINLAGPDLAVSAATAPNTARRGEMVNLSWTVENQGTIPALSDQWYDYVYLSRDTTLSSDDQFITSKTITDLQPLANGDSYSVSADVFIPTNASTSSRYVLFVSDREQQQGELSDDTNNVLALPITIQSGSLTTDTTWSGTIAISGRLTIPEGVKLTIEPGTIVKFNGRSAGLDVKGTLDVQGTLEAPVVLTSWLDDAAGGDNNLDGNTSTPAAGDWQGITFSGGQSVGLFNHTDIRYANLAIYGTQRGAKVELDNTQLTQNNQGIYVYTPLIDITGNNLLIADNRLNGIFMRADSRGVFRNSTIVNNGFSGSGWTAAGIHQGAANLTVENSILAFNRNGWHHSGDTPLTTVNNTIFYNPGGRETVWDRDPGEPDLTANGNRVADPLFVNRFEGNYQLLAGSPAIDSGKAADAPRQDLLGNARFDDVGIANRGAGTPNYVDIGVYEYQGRTTTADLVTTAVTTPDNIAVSVGDTLIVSWTVSNQGEIDTSGSWVDNIYLSSDRNISADDILLETRTQSRQLAPGESYTETLTTAVPASAGPQYILVETDATEVVTESNEINNSRLSNEPLAVDVPVISLDTPLAGAVQSGEWTYFRFDASADKTIQLDLDAAASSDTVALYGRYGAPPTLTEYDAVAAVNQQPDQTLRLVNPSAGDYYIGVYGQSLTGATTFNLTAAETPTALRSVVQTTVTAAGQATLELVGDNFADTDTIKLIAPDGITELTPVSVQYQDPTRTFATFNLNGAALGAYDVVVEPATGAALSLTDELTIEPLATTTSSNFSADLVAPQYVRPGREVTLTVNYQNLSGFDLGSPLLNVTSDQEIEWQIPGTDQWVKDTSISLLALSDNGPAGLLQPGETDTVSFKIRTPLNTDPLNFELFALQADGSSNSSQVIDWDALETQSRPAGLSDEAWAAVWGEVQAQTGSTWADFVAMLNDNATYLKGVGRTVYDAQALLAFEVLQANGLNPEPYLAAGEDAFVAAPGLDLRFVRVYGSSVASRHTQGQLGYGWNHNYDLFVEETDDDRVLVHWADGSFRSFVADDQGGYIGVAGEEGILTEDSGDLFQLREPSGLTYRFGANEKLASIIDTNGNTITASYSNNRLSTLTHSSGQSLTLNYNTDGNLAKVSDGLGNDTDYAYDSSGRYLEQTTTVNGQTTSYTYNKVDHPSLLTISNDAANTTSYSYLGNQLEGVSRNGTEYVAYTRDSAGTVTVSDNSSNSSKLFYGEQGIPVQVEDAEGRLYQFDSDTDGNLVQVTQPGGSNSQMRYDVNGNPTEITDAEGNTIRLKFDSTYGNLEWIQDARGNTMRYRYDGAGNLSEIEYADGSKELFSTDAQGNLDSYTNRREETVTYSYTSDGLIAQQTNSGETPAQYTYDTEGKLLSVVDGQGTTTLTYDTNERLSGLTYPNGRFLSFEYDAVGRRTKLTGSDNYVVQYEYDVIGRLQKLTDGNNDLIVEYGYDAAGRLIREDKGNATYTTYEYFADGQVKSLVHHAPDGSINSRFDYTYDALGRQNSAATLDGTWTYGYDATGQLSRAIFASTNPDIANQDLTYVYDAVGNRIRTINNGVTTAYKANSLNQYETIGDATYKYDNDGNLVEKRASDRIWLYEYSNENQLIKITSPDGSVTSYEYDIFGNRITTVKETTRVEYLVDPFGLGNVIEEYQDNKLLAQYTHGIGLESYISSEESRYYDFNFIGSTTGISGSDGSYLNQYHYLPFGGELLEFEKVTNSFEFVGQWGISEAENDLTFMRARFYDPASGRFLSHDPLGFKAGDTNLYRYVSNNPVNFIDPTGLILWTPILVGAGIGALTDIGLQLISNGGSISDLDWGSVAISAGLGAVGARFGSSTLTKYPGSEWSHWIPGRFSNPSSKYYKGLPRFLTERDSWIGRLNGNYVSSQTHALTDPFRYRFMPRGWKINNPIYSSAARQLYRVPNWLKGTLLGTFIAQSFASITPEDKFGPEGYDAPGTPETEKKRHITAAETFQYRVDFWNDPDAIVPTQTVIIKDQLDPNLDWSTFNFTNFGFLDWNIDVPGGQTINTRVDMRPKFDLAVDVNASFDAATGEITWTFQAVDPVTGDYPDDVFAGFLPPFNEETEYELGWVEFTVDPKDNLTTGTQIANQAFVQFDLVNDFNPAPKEGPWINTIDTDAPDSVVTALASEVTSDFAVAWSGTDIGSGLATYDIYVSQDGGDFTLWLDDTIDTSATYTGDIGSTYAFYSVASDNVGLTEAAPALADTTTRVTSDSQTNAVAQADITAGTETIIEATGTASLVDTLTGYRIDSVNGSVTLTDQGQPVTKTSAADWIPLGVELGEVGFEIIASNNSSNFELWEVLLSGGLSSRQEILAGQINLLENQFNQDFDNNGQIGARVDIV